MLIWLHSMHGGNLTLLHTNIKEKGLNNIFACTSPTLFRNKIVANESRWQCNYVYLFVITKSFREQTQLIHNPRKYPHWDILPFQRVSRKCHCLFSDDQTMATKPVNLVHKWHLRGQSFGCYKPKSPDPHYEWNQLRGSVNNRWLLWEPNEAHRGPKCWLVRHRRRFRV
jgi:hypothetical protein